jgi:predicted nucleic acid-binding protein
VTGTERADLARAVAGAVVAVPGVTRLVGDAGPVEVATLHRGGKVAGVRLTERSVSVHVAVDSLPLREVSTAVGRAVRRVLDEAGDDREIAVVIERLDVERLPGHGLTREADH